VHIVDIIRRSNVIFTKESVILNSMKKKSLKKNAIPTKSISKEVEILEAYSRLQFKKGASKVVLQDLAEDVGVAFGTVRYHFNEAGRDVAEEALIHTIKKAYSYIDDHLYHARKTKSFNPVMAYVEVMLKWVKEFPAEASLIIYYYYLCSTEVKVSISNQVFLEKARLRIEGLIHEAVGRKIYSYPSDVSKLALRIHMTLMGACMVVGTQRNAKEFDMQSNLCKEVISQLLIKS
jgi:hypothetical protein